MKPGGGGKAEGGCGEFAESQSRVKQALVKHRLRTDLYRSYIGDDKGRNPALSRPW